MNLEAAYLSACFSRGDINEHLPLLRSLSSTVERVTEFGTRTGQSTVAFLAGRPKHLTCYDVSFSRLDVPSYRRLADEAGTRLQLVEADTAQIEIEPTDLLLIDTLHTAGHVRRELKQSSQVSRFIVLHDTVKYGGIGEHGEPGIRQAILDFVACSDWHIAYEWLHNNGLMLLQRKGVSP